MTMQEQTEVGVGQVAGTRVELILCPVELSEISAKAYGYAQSIACHFHAKLILQHVVELPLHPSASYCVTPESFDEFRRTLVSNAEHELREFAGLTGGVQPECIVDESMAADAILSLARSRAVSLIVMGTHGRRGFDRAMLGSVTERVLRHATCPVLAVPRKAPDETAGNPADDAVRVRRILCCVDFSAHSQRTLGNALSLRDAFDAEITLLHVLEHIPESADVAVETGRTIENLKELIPPASRDSTNIHLEVRLGKSYQEILQFAAESQPDVIVTGVRGRHALDLAVFGSTTYRVIQLGGVPVLTVPI